MKRKCFKCKTPIDKCNGFCKASDVLERKKVRELCGKCGFFLLFMDEEELREYIQKLEE